MTTLSTTYATGDPNPAAALNTTNTQVNANTTAITNNSSAITANTTAITNNSSAITALQVLVPTAPVLKSLLTTKGNIIAASASATPASVAVGTNNFTLIADSSQVAGVKWAPRVDPATLTAKGSLFVASASGTVAEMAVGADATVPVADSAATNGIAYKSRSFLTSLPPFIPQTGEWVVSPTTSTNTANGYTTGRAYFEAIDITKSTAFERVGTSITATGTGSGQVIRLGLYADDGSGTRPALAPALYDWGTVDPTTGTGDKTITINVTLTPGRYWLCWAIQGTVTTSPTVVTTSLVVQMGLANLGNNSNRVWGHSSISGALPTLTSIFRDSNPPIIGLRAT